MERRIEKNREFFEKLFGVRAAAEFLIENERDGSLLVRIPEGQFLAGGPEPNEGGQGTFALSLPAYYLGIHPVTNAQYARFLTSASPSETTLARWVFFDNNLEIERAGRKYRAVSSTKQHPVVLVKWAGAAAYCDWAGLRLPTELEWEKGARGTDGREHPWGDDWGRPGHYNTHQFGTDNTHPVWAFPAGVSHWGTYQINVFEWCADWYDEEYYARLRAQPDPTRVKPRRGECRGFGRFLIYEDRNQNGRLDTVTDPSQQAVDHVWGPNDAYFLVYVESNAAYLDDPQPGLYYGIAEHLLNLESIYEYRSVDEVLDIELAENPDLQLLMCYEYDLEWVGPSPEYQSPDEVVLPGPLCESHQVTPGIFCGSPSETAGCVQLLCTSEATAYRWFWNCSTTQTSCERVTTWESNGIVILPWGEAPPTDWPCE